MAVNPNFPFSLLVIIVGAVCAGYITLLAALANGFRTRYNRGKRWITFMPSRTNPWDRAEWMLILGLGAGASCLIAGCISFFWIANDRITITLCLLGGMLTIISVPLLIDFITLKANFYLFQILEKNRISLPPLYEKYEKEDKHLTKIICYGCGRTIELHNIRAISRLVCQKCKTIINLGLSPRPQYDPKYISNRQMGMIVSCFMGTLGCLALGSILGWKGELTQEILTASVGLIIGLSISLCLFCVRILTQNNSIFMGILGVTLGISIFAFLRLAYFVPPYPTKPFVFIFLGTICLVSGLVVLIIALANLSRFPHL